MPIKVRGGNNIDLSSSGPGKRRAFKNSPARDKAEKKKLEKRKQQQRNRQRDRKMTDRQYSNNIWTGKDVSPPLSPSSRNRASSSWASITVDNGEVEQFDMKSTKLKLVGQNIKEIPEEVGDMIHLDHLDLRRNDICEFLDARMIRALSSTLTKLKLRGNRISCLPSDIKELRNLAWLDLGKMISLRFPASSLSSAN